MKWKQRNSSFKSYKPSESCKCGSAPSLIRRTTASRWPCLEHKNSNHWMNINHDMTSRKAYVIKKTTRPDWWPIESKIVTNSSEDALFAAKGFTQMFACYQAVRKLQKKYFLHLLRCLSKYCTPVMHFVVICHDRMSGLI